MALVYDFNTYLKGNSDIQTLMGTATPDIHPLVGYPDSAGPFILYGVNADIRSREQFYIRKDTFKYCVMDQDASRCISIAEKIIDLLDKGDIIQGDIGSTDYSPKWSILVEGELLDPVEREGWFQYNLFFEVGYVKNSNIP